MLNFSGRLTALDGFLWVGARVAAPCLDERRDRMRGSGLGTRWMHARPGITDYGGDHRETPQTPQQPARSEDARSAAVVYQEFQGKQCHDVLHGLERACYIRWVMQGLGHPI